MDCDNTSRMVLYLKSPPYFSLPLLNEVGMW